MIRFTFSQRCAAASLIVLVAGCAGTVNSPASITAYSHELQPKSGLGVNTDSLRSLAQATTTNRIAAGSSSAQLKIDQTQGFGADQLLTFTYQQQFDCVDEPFRDRNYDGVVAAEDPAEFYSPPACQIGAPSTLSPSGNLASATDKLFVLVPFFETNPDEPAFTPELGIQMRKLFGFVPDAFKIEPGVAVQCPEPGPPITPFKGGPGTCTMHPLQQDIGPVLSALHLIPPKTILNVPLVNHSHLLDNSQIVQTAEWWQVIVALVKDPSVWPDRSGKTGITSVAKLRAAQKKGLVSPDVPSNFFLFFSSQVAGQHAMPGMPGM